MKQKIILSIFTLILLFGLLIPNRTFAISSNNNNYTIEASDIIVGGSGYTINSYDINMIVNENNTFDITETINVIFYRIR